MYSLCNTFRVLVAREHSLYTLLGIDDYDLVRLDCMVRNKSNGKTKSGGGLATYIHNSFIYSTSELADT